MSTCISKMKWAVASLLAVAVNASASVILVHFGEFALPNVGWNSVTKATNTSGIGVPISLVDNAGAATGATITLNNQFRDNNNAGYSGGPVGDFIAESVAGSLFGDATAPWDEQSLTIAGLDTGFTYTFEIFAARGSIVNPVTDNRSALYTFTGLNSGDAELNASSNTSNLAIIEDILPDVSGEILFGITAGPSNNNASQYYYINAMKITATAVPEPGTTALLMGILATGFILYRRRGRAC